MEWGLIFFARVGSIFPGPSSLQTGLAWLPRAMAMCLKPCWPSKAGLYPSGADLYLQGTFTFLSSICTCVCALFRMPGWAPVPWDVPKSDKSTASPMVRLPPDLGQPRLPAQPSFPVLAKPSGCPRCLGTATDPWARIAVPFCTQCCQFLGVLPGLVKGAQFRIYLGGSLKPWQIGRFKMCPWVSVYLWVWRLLICFGGVPGCGGCRHIGVNFRVCRCCCGHQVHAARFGGASMCQVHLDLFLVKVTSGLGVPLG